MSPTLTMEDLRGLNITLQGSDSPSGSLKPASKGNAAQIAGRTERRDPGTGLNATEASFLSEVLRPLQHSGAILRVDFEPEGLRAGLPGSRSVYWPDFRLQWADGIIDFVEVKGYWLEDARVKIKAVAALHPYTFRAVQRKLRKAGGGWSIETFGPWPDWAARIEAAVGFIM